MYSSHLSLSLSLSFCLSVIRPSTPPCNRGPSTGSCLTRPLTSSTSAASICGNEPSVIECSFTTTATECLVQRTRAKSGSSTRATPSTSLWPFRTCEAAWWAHPPCMCLTAAARGKCCPISRYHRLPVFSGTTSQGRRVLQVVVSVGTTPRLLREAHRRDSARLKVGLGVALLAGLHQQERYRGKSHLSHRAERAAATVAMVLPQQREEEEEEVQVLPALLLKLHCMRTSCWCRAVPTSCYRWSRSTPRTCLPPA